jgi:hypothetical protein
LLAAGFASTITAFCQRLGYWEIHAALRSFTKRVHSLSNSSSRDSDRQSQLQQLSTLVDLKALTRPQARLLFGLDVKTVEQVAALDLTW